MTAGTPVPAAAPDGYRLLREIDLKRGRPAVATQAIAAAGIAIAAGVAVAGGFPPSTDWSTPVTVAVTLAAVLTYFALHELTHGAALRVLSPSPPIYRLRFPFLTTGTTAFLAVRPMVVVCLTPFAVWGLAFAVALATLPDDALLTAYVLAAVNLAGSAGDFVQAGVAAALPRGARLRDAGDVTTVVVPR